VVKGKLVAVEKRMSAMHSQPDSESPISICATRAVRQTNDINFDLID
jgi:hypothetical protein